MGLQQKLIFLVVPLPLGLRPSPLGLSSFSTWAFIFLHLGLAKYTCYRLLEGIHWLFGPTPSHRSLYLGSFMILIIDKGPEAEALPRILIFAEGPD